QKTAEAQKMATGNDSEYTPDNLIVPDEMHIAEFNSDNERKKQ
ncbi:ribonuclease domain protein, partial [Rahnella aquatilis CIP 78.65 = ATCC 33071]